MTHLQQPRRSSVCGQTCVAMLASVSIDESVEACTGCRRRASSEHDLRRGLRAFGLDVATFTRDVIPPWHDAKALVRVRFEWRPHGYHWIVRNGPFVFDPDLSHPVIVEVYERYLRRRRGYITSWARVNRLASASANQVGRGVDHQPTTGNPDCCSASRARRTRRVATAALDAARRSSRPGSDTPSRPVYREVPHV